MRGAWSKKCLEGQAKKVVDDAGEGMYEAKDGVESGRAFGKWVELVLTVAEDEYSLLADLAPLTSTQLIAQAYAALLTPILGLVSGTIAALMTLIKRSLQKYAFLALSTYEALLRLHPKWEGLLALRDNNSKSEAGNNEVKDGLNSLRGVCLRSFPEMIADLKSAAMSKSYAGLAEYTGAVTDFTQSVRWFACVIMVT